MQIIKYADKNKAFQKNKELSTEKIVKAHNNFIKKICRNEKSGVEPKEWQSLLDKLFNQKTADSL